eukprot:TRINITY_DN73349_c0_g1_i1.p1 TRINITY_DN73349_c0_g1~~TRINITY_DN73349_c0_g1_i1.p1  ORF type:complete len:389 (+),score=63.04 TRINITY_DN73349_c0_g1_i1:211-1377(+)
MKGYVYDSSGLEGVGFHSHLSDPDSASLKPGFCLVDVKACGVNPVDAKFCVGDKLPHFLHSCGRCAVQGNVIGFDFAGVVSAVNGGAGQFSVGDRVFGAMPPMAGSFAQRIAAPLSQLAHIPPSPTGQMSFTDAAALPLVSITSVQSLKHDHSLRTAQSVLIIGSSGGVGCIATQVAKSLVGPTGFVCGVCSQRNADFSRSNGCDVVVDYTSGIDRLLRDIKQALTRRGTASFDVVLDCVSSLEEKDRAFDYISAVNTSGILKAALNNPASRSNYITIGGSPFDWAKATFRRLTGWNLFGGRGPASNYDLFWVRFPNCGEFAPRVSDSASGGAALKDVREMLESGELRVEGLVTVIPDAMGRDGLQKVRDAFRAIHSRRVRGKLVLAL